MHWVHMKNPWWESKPYLRGFSDVFIARFYWNNEIPLGFGFMMETQRLTTWRLVSSPSHAAKHHQQQYRGRVPVGKSVTSSDYISLRSSSSGGGPSLMAVRGSSSEWTSEASWSARLWSAGFTCLHEGASRSNFQSAAAKWPNCVSLVGPRHPQWKSYHFIIHFLLSSAHPLSGAASQTEQRKEEIREVGYDQLHDIIGR